MNAVLALAAAIVSSASRCDRVVCTASSLPHSCVPDHTDGHACMSIEQYWPIWLPNQSAGWPAWRSCVATYRPVQLGCNHADLERLVMRGRKAISLAGWLASAALRFLCFCCRVSWASSCSCSSQQQLAEQLLAKLSRGSCLQMFA